MNADATHAIPLPRGHMGDTRDQANACHRLDCLHLLRPGRINVAIAPKPERVKSRSGITLDRTAPTTQRGAVLRSDDVTPNVAMVPLVRAIRLVSGTQSRVTVTMIV